MDATRLEIRDLRFRYEDMEMRFDLDAHAGETLALIGPSGAGKSTLLNLIAGFESPLSGIIHVNGKNILDLRPADRPVTTLFQEHNLFAHLRVQDNVALGIHPGLKLTANERKQVADALASVGLTGMERRLPSELSGGQRQRVALARSLVRHRPLLLLDEPFAALGPALKHEMLDLVTQIRDSQNLAVIFVSHDPNDARYAAQRSAFIYNGKVAAIDTTERLLDSSAITELRRYLGNKRGQGNKTNR